MPPPLAALLTICFIVWVFRRDKQQNPHVPRALWLPTIWMMIIGSRQMGQWFSLCGLNFAGQSDADGNPIDAVVYLALNMAGIYVLSRRRATLAEIMRNNGWMALFYLYCFLSVFWSDLPFVAFKRWIKEIGLPIMALVILSEPDSDEALWTVMKRSAFVLVPVSVLFIKYYPALGRYGQLWGGQDINTGITTDKNVLGCVCFILGLVFVWHWLKIWKMEKSKARKDELFLTGFFLWMIAWLMQKAHSVTSDGVFVLGVLILFFLSRRWVNKNLIGSYAIGASVIVLVFNTSGLSDYVIGLMGKDPTLTGRVEIWNDLFRLGGSPIFGTGFESFWLGERLQKLWAIYWWHPNEAHNGYLEIYLDLGLIGLFLLFGVLLATFWKCKRDLLQNSAMSPLRLACLGAIVVYNWTEAAYKGLHPVFFLFFIVALDYPSPQTDSVPEWGDAASAEEDSTLVSAGTNLSMRME
jgi:exopolysaccharide production protein ExoQ